MNFILGMNCVLQVSDTLYDDTPAALPQSGAAMTNVRDVTINLETGEADVTTRANKGWRATAATLKDGTVEFEAIFKPSDPQFGLIKTAWLAAGEIAAAVMTGDTDGEGVAGNFTVTNFSMSQPLEEGVTVSITLKPSSHTTWLVIGGE